MGAALIASEKNGDAGRMLTTGTLGEPAVPKANLSGYEWIGVINALLSGNCTDEDEDAIVDIVRYLAGSGQAELVDKLIGASRMDAGVEGWQWNEIRAIMKGAGYEWSWWG